MRAWLVQGQTLACLRRGPDSNTGIGIWLGSVQPSKASVFPGNFGFCHLITLQNAKIHSFDNTYI